MCSPSRTTVLLVFYSLEKLCSFLRNLCASLKRSISLQEVQYNLCRCRLSCSKIKENVVLSIKINSGVWILQLLFKVNQKLNACACNLSIVLFHDQQMFQSKIMPILKFIARWQKIIFLKLLPMNTSLSKLMKKNQSSRIESFH